jgi:MEDS: MEthanogen/methylotroph, DcmR Sensory domain
MGKAASEPIPFAGSQLGATRHVCAFFRNADEEYRVLLPFIQDGFESGDRAFHIVDPKLRNEHRRRLASAGIDVAVAERNGQLRLHDWNDTYFRHGRFDQHAMLAFIEAELKEGAGQGFRLSRAIGHVAWALEDRPDVQDVVEFEARLNYILPRYQDPIICVYDLARFGAAIVVDMLRTHPMVIIGGILQENPFFVPPDEFLCDLSERRAVTGR